MGSAIEPWSWSSGPLGLSWIESSVNVVPATLICDPDRADRPSFTRVVILVVPRPALRSGIGVPLMTALSVPVPAIVSAVVLIVTLPSSSARGVNDWPDAGTKPNSTPALVV